MSKVIRVLIVDDSAFVRKMVRRMLERSPYVEVVGAARDGEEALELVDQLNPDVVTLDLHMPRMDGVEFLRRQMVRRPVPVVLLSIATEGGDLAMQALDAGAVDLVQKPTALATDRVLDVADDLITKVKAAAMARVEPRAPSPMGPLSATRAGGRRTDIVVIGVSTGGPQALKQILPRLPADFPVPIAMVLHMPVGFTELYAQSLAAVSRLVVTEAKDGDFVRPGVALLAQAGYHLTLARADDGGVVTRLALAPHDTPHRPSVDVLFRSAAELYGNRVLGLILTGMGRDGTLGAGWVKANGGRVFTEAEQTSVVYGMPRSVVEAGLSDAQVPLPDMAQAILEAL